MSELESAKYWLSWIELGSTVALLLVAIGVGYEFVANRLEKPLRAKVEAARERELEQLRSDTAQANERAADANLELARLKAPRTLNAEQRQQLTREMEAYSGQCFLCLPSQKPKRWT